MKIKTLIIVILIFCSTGYKSQILEREKWFPVMISIHGTVDHEGVEANAKITKCNGKDVMLLELINTNAYSVKCEWLHAPIDKDGKQHYKDDLQTLLLNAKETKTGKCGEAKQLIIKLSDYAVKVEDVQNYYGSNFNVTQQ